MTNTAQRRIAYALAALSVFAFLFGPRYSRAQTTHTWGGVPYLLMPKGATLSDALAADGTPLRCALSASAGQKRTGRYTLRLRRVITPGDTSFVSWPDLALTHAGGVLNLCVAPYNEAVNGLAIGSLPDSVRTPPGSNNGETLIYERIVAGQYVLDAKSLKSPGGLTSTYEGSAYNGLPRGIPGYALGGKEGGWSEHDVPLSVRYMDNALMKGGNGMSYEREFRLQRGPVLLLAVGGAEIFGSVNVFSAGANDSLLYAGQGTFSGSNDTQELGVDRGPNRYELAAFYGTTSQREDGVDAISLGFAQSTNSWNNNAAYGSIRLPYDTGVGNGTFNAGVAAWNGHAGVGFSRTPDGKNSKIEWMRYQADPLRNPPANGDAAQHASGYGRLGRTPVGGNVLGLDFLNDGGIPRLYVSTGTSVKRYTVSFPVATANTNVAFTDSAIVLPALVSVKDITVLPAGRMGLGSPAHMLLSFGGNVNVVRLYSLANPLVPVLVRTFGTAGPRQYGTYDPSRFRDPAGCDIVPPLVGMGVTEEGQIDPLANKRLLVCPDPTGEPRRFTFHDADTGVHLHSAYGQAAYNQPGTFARLQNAAGYSIATDSIITLPTADNPYNGSVVEFVIRKRPGFRPYAVPRAILWSPFPSYTAATGFTAKLPHANGEVELGGAPPFHHFQMTDANGVTRDYYTDGHFRVQRGSTNVYVRTANSTLRRVAGLYRVDSSPCLALNGTTVTHRGGATGVQATKAFVRYLDYDGDGVDDGCSAEWDIYNFGSAHQENFNVVTTDMTGAMWEANGRVLMPGVINPVSGVPAYVMPTYVGDFSATEWVKAIRSPTVATVNTLYEGGNQPGPQSPAAFRMGSWPTGVYTVMRPGVQTTTHRLGPATSGSATLSPSPGGGAGLSRLALINYSYLRDQVNPETQRINAPSYASPPAPICPQWAGRVAAPIQYYAGGYGEGYLVDGDGWPLDNVGADARRTGFWNRSRPVYGANVSNLGMSGETYGADAAGVYGRDGKCTLYALDGFGVNVFRHEGLDSLVWHKNIASFTVTQAMVDAWPQRVAVRYDKGGENRVYTALSGTAVIDGNASDWTEAELVRLNTEPRRAGLRRGPAGTGLYGIFVTDVGTNFRIGSSGGREVKELPMDGGGDSFWLSHSNDLNKGDPYLIPIPLNPRNRAPGDMRLFFGRMSGAPTLRQWAPLTWANGPSVPCTVTSPLGSIAFQVCARELLGLGATMSQSIGGTTEWYVPYLLLGKTYSAGEAVLGDFETLVGNGLVTDGNTDALRRSFFNNRSQTITFDGYGEANPFHQHWGTLAFSNASVGVPSPSPLLTNRTAVVLDPDVAHANTICGFFVQEAPEWTCTHRVGSPLVNLTWITQNTPRLVLFAQTSPATFLAQFRQMFKNGVTTPIVAHGDNSFTQLSQPDSVYAGLIVVGGEDPNDGSPIDDRSYGPGLMIDGYNDNAPAGQGSAQSWAVATVAGVYARSLEARAGNRLESLSMLLQTASTYPNWSSLGGYGIVRSNEVLPSGPLALPAKLTHFRPYNKPPVLSVSRSVTSCVAPCTVTYTSIFSDPDFNSANILWSFSQGGTAATPSVTRTYQLAGTYTETATLTDVPYAGLTPANTVATATVVITAGGVIDPPPIGGITEFPARLTLVQRGTQSGARLDIGATVRLTGAGNRGVLWTTDEAVYLTENALAVGGVWRAVLNTLNSATPFSSAGIEVRSGNTDNARSAVLRVLNNGRSIAFTARTRAGALPISIGNPLMVAPLSAAPVGLQLSYTQDGQVTARRCNVTFTTCSVIGAVFLNASPTSVGLVVFSRSSATANATFSSMSHQ